ncbi:hypothetical protein Tco_0616964, partial [Tanacetum coccineum]
LLRKDSDDELKELSGDDIFEAKEDMDDPFSLLADETQPPPSTEQPSTEQPSTKSQHVEPTSTEHKSPSPEKA